MSQSLENHYGMNTYHPYTPFQPTHPEMSAYQPSSPHPLPYIQSYAVERVSLVERELSELRGLCENQANMLTILQSTVANLLKGMGQVSVSGELVDTSSPSHLAPNTFLPLSQACRLSGMPSTATIRKWIREGRLIEYDGGDNTLIENCHYKRVGERGFIYLNPTKLLADRHTF